MICVQSLEIQLFFICPSFCRYLVVFGFFISLFVVVMVRQRMRVRFCTGKVPGRWSLHSFFDDCSHFQKKGTYTGFMNDNKTITTTITFGIKNGPCETRSCFFLSSPFPLPFLSLSSPFPLLFSFPSFSFSFSFSFPFSFLFLFLFLSFFFSYSFPFSFPIPFLFLSFSFPFPFSFIFLSLSFSSPFPILFVSLPLLFLFLFPFPRSCESFGQGVKPALGKTVRGKKRERVKKKKKTFERARGFDKTPGGFRSLANQRSLVNDAYTYQILST